MKTLKLQFVNMNKLYDNNLIHKSSDLKDFVEDKFNFTKTQTLPINYDGKIKLRIKKRMH